MSDGRCWLICGALFAGLSVAAAAFGAHGLKPRVEKGEVAQNRLDDFEIAARNQMYHALGLLAVGLLIRTAAGKSWLPHLAGAAFLLGTLCFCGGLYGYALTDNKTFTAVAPAGGISFMAGWLLLALAAWRTRGKSIE